jgi:hypothetical protein
MYRAYQMEPPGEDVLELYHAALSQFSLIEIRTAAGQHLKTSKWFPKISELIELIPSAHIPKLESIATVQAGVVLKMIREFGSRFEPLFNDPVTAHLMRTRFNYRGLCMNMIESEEKWFVKNFIESYLAMNDWIGGDTERLGLEAPAQLKQLTGSMFKSIE